MAGDSVADFLTFVSPICILVLFFMCFFRFLFRSCECGTNSDDLEACHREEMSAATARRMHGCLVHGVNDEFSSPYGDMVFCPNNCEEAFPPKYEDALKMAVCTARSEDPRRVSVQIQDNHNRSSRPSITSPPPGYIEATTRPESPVSTSTIVTQEGAQEMPPNYSPNLSAATSTSTGQVAAPRMSVFQPILRVTNAFRRTAEVSEPLPDRNKEQAPRLSLGDVHAQIPSVSGSLTHLRHHSGQRRGSLRPPRVPLPGAVDESDEESDVESVKSTATRVTQTRPSP